MNRSLAFFGRQELIKNLRVFYTRRLLCKESSKKGLAKRSLASGWEFNRWYAP